MSKKNKDNKTKTKSNNFDCHCTKKNSTNNFEENGE